MPDPMHVVVHRPGSKWKTELPPFEQPGLRDHVAYYQKLLDDGRLFMGGPFLDTPGGMMVFEANVPRETVDALSAADPAVLSGLLVYDVRPWFPRLRR